MKIIQQHYPDIKIDETEKDIIQIWQHGERDVDVIQIELSKIDELINCLETIKRDRKL